MAVSKNLEKLIRSLETKKGRKKEGLFVAEGPKVVGDLMAVSTPVRLIATETWFASMGITPREQDAVVSEDELRKVSFLQHPQQVMGLFPQFPPLTSEGIPTSEGICRSALPLCSSKNPRNPSPLILALDGVQDPGNLGTIIRIADWFGIDTIYCSQDTADVYNPKVVQATMGSIARVHIAYIDLPEWLTTLPKGLPVYGTFLDGRNIYDQELTPHGIIVMGNEANGISPEVAAHVNRRLLIPNYPPSRETADSLNVAIATAITCAEFRRRGLGIK